MLLNVNFMKKLISSFHVLTWHDVIIVDKILENYYKLTYIRSVLVIVNLQPSMDPPLIVTAF